MLNITQLKTYVTVINEGNLSAAAEKLSLTQPAVSQHIQSLEDYFGIPLFSRRGRTLELSPTGNFIYQKAQQLLQTHEEIETAIFDQIFGSIKNINLASGPIMADYVIPHLIAFTQKNNPLIGVSLEPSETESILKGILEFNYDVGFIGTEMENNKLHIIPWIEDEMVLIAPPNHEFASMEEGVNGEDLLNQKMVWLKGITGIHQTLDKKFKKIGVNFKDIPTAMEVSGTTSVITSVEAGLGITIISKWATINAIKAGSVKIVPIKNLSLNRYLYVVTHKNRRKPPILEEFLKYVMLFKEEYKEILHL